MIDVSVVIPTRNRKERLLSLLKALNQSTYLLNEVIIIDSSDIPLYFEDYVGFERLRIVYQMSAPSVCIQRNTGIRLALSNWIFLCDDDIEFPMDYLQKVANYLEEHPDVGAVSGKWHEKANDRWVSQHPISSPKELLLKYIFGLGLWGVPSIKTDNFFLKRIDAYYDKKGNHISNAGWPVITDFSSSTLIAPIYSLGAAVVRKDWLLASSFDEVLDPHGLGDNYGVILGFPIRGVHVLKHVDVYHHHAAESRLQKPQEYFRRALALDYFIRTRRTPENVKRSWFLFSLLGNAIIFSLRKDPMMARPSWRTFWNLLTKENPYYLGAMKGQKVIEPALPTLHSVGGNNLLS
jgi:glycosyltransferase involved in cell wall biosynthesis